MGFKDTLAAAFPPCGYYETIGQIGAEHDRPRERKARVNEGAVVEKEYVTIHFGEAQEKAHLAERMGILEHATFERVYYKEKNGYRWHVRLILCADSVVS